MLNAHRVLAGLLVTVLALTARAAEIRIGYVDLQKALTQTDDGKTAKDKLQREFSAKQKKLDQAQEELKSEKERLDKQGPLWTDEKRREFQSTLERKFMETTQLWQQMQKELSEAEAKATGEIFMKMEVIIREIAETEGFTHVFDRKQSGLIFAPESMDLTPQLVRKFNDRYPAKKAAGSASSAGGAAATKAGSAPQK